VTREQPTEAVRDYFTREADRFDAIYEGSNRTTLQAAVDAFFRTRALNERNARVAALVDEGARCFEIGCGSGRTAVAIARARAAQVHGIDMAAPMIDLARALAEKAGVTERCSFEVAEFDAYVPASRYDAFLAVGVLDYFTDPLPMLQRAAREFVPGGSIVLSWPRKRMLLNPARRAWLATKGVPVTFYDEREITNIAAALGGHVTRSIRNTSGPFRGDGLTRIDLAA
jgi:2-polyprenyl-3-methyl-5-hydroxy-6-metoxy-1,4-benzoquinol methylase